MAVPHAPTGDTRTPDADPFEHVVTWLQLTPGKAQQLVVVLALTIAIVLVVSVLLWQLQRRPATATAAAANPRRRLRSGSFKARPILTPNEQEFYGRLVRALPGHAVLCQVSMSALIEPDTDDPGDYQRRRLTFSQKYVDFVIVDATPGRDPMRVVAIVELDDITHDAQKDAQRDAMLNSAGYTVLRWQSRRKPDIHAIRRSIEQLKGC